MMLVKCILPDEKPEIIPLPQQSVLDKGDFIFDPTTLISVENEKQAMIAQELTDIFNQAAGFSPQIAIQEKQADIIFRTDMSLSAEHYKLNISPSCILVEASGNKGFFYAIQTLRFLLPPAINSQTPVKNIQWNVPGMTIHDGPRYNNRYNRRYFLIKQYIFTRFCRFKNRITAVNRTINHTPFTVNLYCNLCRLFLIITNMYFYDIISIFT